MTHHSDQQSIRDEMRRLILDYLPGADGAADSATIADAIMASPAIRRIQAKAVREAANWKRQHNLEHAVWGEYLTTLALEKYQAGGDDMITIWLNDRADRIENGDLE